MIKKSHLPPLTGGSEHSERGMSLMSNIPPAAFGIRPPIKGGAVNAYSHLGTINSITPLASGLINKTFLVATTEQEYILQEVSSIFKPSVHKDILAVTKYLKKQGLLTPELILTKDKKEYFYDEENKKVYRALTYIKGLSFDKVESLKVAFEAGLTLGKFHRALKDFTYEYQHLRIHGADFLAHFNFLKQTLKENPHHDYFHKIKDLSALMLEEMTKYLSLKPKKNHAHGDVKISNILFDENQNSLCLVDLDTLGYLSWSQDLADAFRSWANPNKEDAPNPQVDLNIIKKSLEGYLSVMDSLIAYDDLALGVKMAEGITLCLSMRYLTDVINESYFAFDNTSFKRPAEQNLLRARSMWQLYNEFTLKEAEIFNIVDDLFCKIKK